VEAKAQGLGELIKLLVLLNPQMLKMIEENDEIEDSDIFYPEEEIQKTVK
jgi:hypothetical protein